MSQKQECQCRQYNKYDEERKNMEKKISLSGNQQRRLEEGIKRGVFMALHRKALLSDLQLNLLLNKNP